MSRQLSSAVPCVTLLVNTKATEPGMKFILTFTWTRDAQKRAKGIALFKKTGGSPPEGVKLLGRWTKVDFSGGFDLLETEDPKKLIEFAYMWGDLMELNVFPVLTDHELSEALQKAMKKTRPASR
jgi:Protein of unknown function (DUF3303)